MPSKQAPPDIPGKGQRINNGLANFNINAPQWNELTMTNEANRNNGIGMTQGSPGTSRSEEIIRGPDQTREGHESNSAGLRKNGAAVGAGQNTERLQITDKRAGEDFGSEQSLPIVIRSYLSSAHWGETKSRAGMNYTKHRTQKLFEIFEHGGAEAPSERTGDQKPGYSHEFRYPNLSEEVQRYEVFDPPIFSGGLHDPSDIGRNGFRNALSAVPIFVSYTNMGLVLLLGVFCS
uniref:Uncharacterized protein n=1 Tax=Octactis speculum TaxID=3111310 RepID=A0A7S2BW32_9STRA|mmetsp:Transcript_28199/g.38602  ORF Transcript_28199/g.38602 Transcript_28199/m.38602 type:complete len:234 (+) Transcript_28199:59-760(+)